MKWSHSKLQTIISNPANYYYSYILGLQSKVAKPALSLGSAVHWGLEHNTEDLTEYYKNSKNFKQQNDYSKERIMAESMLHAFFKEKDSIYKKILTDPNTNEPLTLIEESHELFITCHLKTSQTLDVPYHEFVGIIDLLLLTDKGFIILDYKTSSTEPSWDDYLDQIYRYIMLLQNSFPDVPIVKVGIINLKKSSIRQKQKENDIEYLNRLKNEYEYRSFEYIQYHEYPMSTLNQQHINKYIDNLSKMCDLAYLIDKNKLFYINFGEAINKYGKSEFYDIYYDTPDNYLLYQISDRVWSEDDNCFVDTRDCLPVDIQASPNTSTLNKYNMYKAERKDHYQEFGSHSLFVDYLKSKYITDDKLLDLYELTFNKEFL